MSNTEAILFIWQEGLEFALPQVVGERFSQPLLDGSLRFGHGRQRLPS